MESRRTRGKIIYQGDTVGERGREWFHRTDHPDGSMVVRSVCEIDDIPLLRDVTFVVDAQFRPVECYERLVVRGDTSSGWFRFSDREVICEGFYHDLGRVSQRHVVDRWPQYFGAHPLVGDVLVMAGFDIAKGGRQTLRGFMSSPLVNGSTGPIATPHQVVADYLGEEVVATPVGPRQAHHFRLYYGPELAKFEDIWVGERSQYVQVRNEELRTTYLLVEFEEF